MWKLKPLSSNASGSVPGKFEAAYTTPMIVAHSINKYRQSPQGAHKKFSTSNIIIVLTSKIYVASILFSGLARWIGSHKSFRALGLSVSTSN